MEKLIITVTCDSTISYPLNPHNPTPNGLDAVVQEYVRSVAAGAAICHIHGPFKPRGSFAEGGAQEVDLDVPGWMTMRERILGLCSNRPIIQYGYAHAPFQQRLVLLQQKPDMVSVCFHPHDECFNYDEPKHPAIDLYAIHDRNELAQYGRFCLEHGITPEIENFQFGGVWNAQRLLAQGLLKTPVWATQFLGWRGGNWTPPTLKGIQFMYDHQPGGFLFNTSVMDPPMHWHLLTMAILLGGHVRVGMEDNPYLSEGRYARTNAELVEKIVRIARELGRDIASPEQARATMGMEK